MRPPLPSLSTERPLSSTAPGVRRYEVIEPQVGGCLIIGEPELAERAAGMVYGGPFQPLRIEAGPSHSYVHLPERLLFTLSDARPLPPPAAFAVLLRLAEALDGVHDNQVVHSHLYLDSVGFDALGRLRIAPALHHPPTAPKGQPPTAADDCLRLGQLLCALLGGSPEELSSLPLDGVDPRSAKTILRGLLRGRPKLRLSPARAVRQTLATLFSRSGISDPDAPLAAWLSERGLPQAELNSPGKVVLPLAEPSAPLRRRSLPEVASFGEGSGLLAQVPNDPAPDSVALGQVDLPPLAAEVTSDPLTADEVSDPFSHLEESEISVILPRGEPATVRVGPSPDSEEIPVLELGEAGIENEAAALTLAEWEDEEDEEEAARVEAEQIAADEAERLAAAEAARAEAEQAEAARIAAEKAARIEAERQAAEQAERAEAERRAAEEAARIEAERLAAEEAARIEAERLAAEEAARIEAERVEAERRAAEEAARIEAERLAAEEAARIEAERAEAERRAAEEAARIEAERLAAKEAARIEAERLAAEEAARIEAERVEAERRAAEEAARIEAERLAAEEAARIEAERIEAERVEAELRAAEEAARIEAEGVEAERLAAEEAERVEAERVEAERIEAERVEAERIEAERAEAERIEAERIEAERIEAERVEAERIEAERIEAERLAAEEAARIEAERIERERLAAEEAARIEAEQAAERARTEAVAEDTLDAALNPDPSDAVAAWRAEPQGADLPVDGPDQDAETQDSETLDSADNEPSFTDLVSGLKEALGKPPEPSGPPPIPKPAPAPERALHQANAPEPAPSTEEIPPPPESILDRERGQSPAWGDADLGVGRDARREEELGDGKWTESGRSAKELADQLPSSPVRELEIEGEDSGGRALLIGIVVAVLLLGGLLWMLMGSESATPITVQTHPAGLRVSIDGQDLGTAPAQFELPEGQGEHRVCAYVGEEQHCKSQSRAQLRASKPAMVDFSKE